jgi:hypothetical protein
VRGQRDVVEPANNAPSNQRRQVCTWDIVHMQLQKPIPEGQGQGLPTTVQAGRVLGRKQHELVVWAHHLLGLRNEQLPVVDGISQSINEDKRRKEE